MKICRKYAVTRPVEPVVLNLLVNSAHAITEAVENGSIEKGLITVSSYREEARRHEGRDTEPA
jgi:hypothetical protein